MSGKTCFACGKTAYPLEQINAGGKVYHNACFKCKECGVKLNLKNFFFDQGTQAAYCKNHVPQAKATQVTDSVAMRQALNAPKKEAENIGTVQKGCGGKPQTVCFGDATPRTQAAMMTDQQLDALEDAIEDAIVEAIEEAVEDAW